MFKFSQHPGESYAHFLRCGHKSAVDKISERTPGSGIFTEKHARMSSEALFELIYPLERPFRDKRSERTVVLRLPAFHQNISEIVI